MTLTRNYASEPRPIKDYTFTLSKEAVRDLTEHLAAFNFHGHGNGFEELQQLKEALIAEGAETGFGLKNGPSTYGRQIK